ncbi:Zinc finger protein CONSTANS 3 [Spatholobus suberectus]|nr:Zinc finger protein CONSTANS 3 [Spatholobus suberectus]
MSSDLYTFDISFHTHSSPDNMVSYEGDGDLLFFSDPCPFPFFTASPIDVLQGNFNNSLDPSFFSFSPQENESFFHANPVGVQPLSSAPNTKGEFTNFSALHGSEVTSEECQMGVDYTYNQHFLSQTCHGSESASKLLHRSFSCNSFDGKPGFPFEPHPDTLMDSPNFQWRALNSPENIFFTGEMRRVCSAGDLQSMKATDMSQTESPLLEEQNFKVGRYSAEERKQKISKYIAKRSQRKFNKIIKYACRKTLADNRTRIRGRFARNDEISEIPKAPCSSSTTEEYEDEFWVEFIEGLNDEVIG